MVSSESHPSVVVVHASHTESSHTIPAHAVPSVSWDDSDIGAEPVWIDSAAVVVRADDGVVGAIVRCAIYVIIEKEYIRPCINYPSLYAQSIRYYKISPNIRTIKYQ